MKNDNSVIKPRTRIIGLGALSAYELVLLIIMLVAANAVGFGTYIVDKGLVATISTPLLLVLFLLALIYEIRRFWGKSRNRWGRYAFYIIAAVLIVGSTVWYAVHSPVGGDQLLTPMRQYTGELSAPLLADISPAENAELEAWIEKNPAENDGQHLIIWRGLSVLKVDYSGAASLAEHLELYASAID